MIQVEQLTKHYRQGKNVVRALDGVSLGIEEGEFIAVVGRSGSGKTTMLDTLGLLLRPTSGRIVIDGTDTTRLNDDRKAQLRVDKIGFIFQEYNLLPTLNAIENVMLPLQYARHPKGDRGWARAPAAACRHRPLPGQPAVTGARRRADRRGRHRDQRSAGRDHAPDQRPARGDVRDRHPRHGPSGQDRPHHPPEGRQGGRGRDRGAGGRGCLKSSS